ncbi:PhnD/SsuA/transferrin family substrate-binding protein [Azotobacter vinelandii]|uniref:PhnD/SsuA/transferrin family substrate-binding protein n=1 Tax=Azotobacter vinelandii TaxID=354 RepID=UPI0007739232|nr:PhnD/SsuA/transferrin family substrate-binding protein [Azotobacter vinelandii]
MSMIANLPGRLLILLSLALLAACGADPEPPRPSAGEAPDLSGVVLRVGAPNKIGNRPYLQVAGQLENLPYRIEWSEFSATPALLEALRGGNIDIGGNGGSTGILFEVANNTDSGIKVIAAGRAVSTGAGAAILVRGDSPYKGIADLGGTRFSVVKGTGSQYLLGQALKKENLGLDDLQLLHLTNDAALAALLAGHIDAWATWDPQASVLQSHPDLRLLGWIGNPDDSWTIQYASQQALDDPGKRAAIADFLGRLAYSTVWVGRHPEQWAEVSGQLTRIDPAVMLGIARKTRTEYGLDGEQRTALEASFRREADFWRSIDVIGAAPEIPRLFDHRFNERMLEATRRARQTLGETTP